MSKNISPYLVKKEVRKNQRCLSVRLDTDLIKQVKTEAKKRKLKLVDIVEIGLNEFLKAIKE